MSQQILGFFNQNTLDKNSKRLTGFFVEQSGQIFWG